MADETRRLLKIFGVAVTDFEAEAEKLETAAAQLSADSGKEQSAKLLKDVTELCRELKQEFKVEHIQTGLAEEKGLSFYRQGEFIDLCRGKHIPSTGHIGTGFKLLSVSGVY